MQKVNIYLNKDNGSKRKDAFEFAIYCLQNNIDMMKLSQAELMRLKAEWNKTHFNKAQWRPTEQEIAEAEAKEKAKRNKKIND